MKGYSEALEYLYSLEKLGIVFGLENIKWLLNIIGKPQGVFRAIHIGGTNGKGSVASMLSWMLKLAGYRVGKYTSPHLVSFRERITINEEEITEEEVAELTADMRQEIEREDPDRPFTFFDFTTALAFEYFRRRHVDLALVEVGLGGRLDSTNVVQSLITVITNVTRDHMDYLGDTITDIAKEKAGIIKDGVPVVTGAVDGPRRIIEETAGRLGSPVYVMGRDFSYEKKGDQTMSYAGLSGARDDLFINLKGDHQFANAAVALCAAELLSSSGYEIGAEHMRRGLAGVTWPGRIEVMREKPAIVVDGAHNIEGISALVQFLTSRFPDRRKILVFGVMRDKEYKKMLALLAPLADTTILTKPGLERALSPVDLGKCVDRGIIMENVRAALGTAKAMATEGDVIVITGSLYLVGEARAIIDEIF